MKFGDHQLLFAATLSALLLISCGKSEKSAPARGEASSRSVRVVRAGLRPIKHTVQVVGTLSAYEDTIVAAQVAGQIEKYKVDLGDRIPSGEELALIDTAAYEARARQSAANLAKAEAAATNARQILRRIQDLQQDKISSPSDLDQAVAEAEKAAADVKAAEAANAIAQLDLERSRVKAPFAGAVAERLASVGNYVAVGAPILRIVKTDPLRLRVDVPERDSALVQVGQAVRVTIEGDTNVYAGKLARVAPAIRDSDRMLPVEADVPNHGELRAGLFVRAQIVVSEGEDRVSVPLEALITFAGIEKVVLVRDGAALEQTVTTGRRGADWVEIVSGLSAGEAVVLNPIGLRTGQKVAVGPIAEKAAANAPAEGAQ